MSPDTVKPQSAQDRDALPTGPIAGRTGQLVRELPLPANLRSEIEALHKRRGHRREWVADELKLQYHYGGKTVAVIQTDRGLMVLAVGDSLESPEIAGLRESLTPEENERTILDSFPRWGDDTSRL